MTRSLDPAGDVAKILGHSTPAVTMRCAHFAPKAGRAGIDKLGNALRGDASNSGSDAAAGAAAPGVAEALAHYEGLRSA